MGFLKTILGWWALALIAAAILGAQLLRAHRFLHVGLWATAAVIGLAGAWNAFRGRG